ncbi:HD domain-containing protein [Paenibacillus sp. J2TS4]|uniref:HD domain-containing protein n=1 Tax=Paenibacillus sp. J2TS4 TaxID=2807194 RepID=UPI001B2B2CF8|nr:HD domain-containing protein [Paenibacillus sp. J2TS4]GIP33267.1 hydrolase [Paenibacillus sp. J2TS4]
MENTRLLKQIEFIVEIDKLKSVYRKSVLMDKSRTENDAEHTWHLSVMAILLLEHANDEEIDILRVLKMLLVHDLVEIDAGDTFAYDDKGHEDKYERELAAAKRIFSLLPEDQREEFLALWHEFEDRVSSESRYAAALDRLQPLLHNYYTEGYTWQKYGITSDKVLARNRHISEGSASLWAFAENLIRSAVDKGYLER